MTLRNLLLSTFCILALSSCSVGNIGEMEVNGYSHQPEGLHYTIVTFTPSANVVMNDLKEEVKAFNEKKHYVEDKLRLSNIFLGANTTSPLLVIRRFDDYDAANKYARSLKRSLKKSNADLQSVWAISQENYRNLLRSKDLEAFNNFADKAHR